MKRRDGDEDPRPADWPDEPWADASAIGDGFELPSFPDDFALGEPTFAADEPAFSADEVPFPADDPSFAVDEVPFPADDPSFAVDDPPLPVPMPVGAGDPRTDPPIVATAEPESTDNETVDLPEADAYLPTDGSDPAAPLPVASLPAAPELLAESMLLEELGENPDHDQCVTFWAAGIRFAVPIRDVVQVGDVGPVTRVPRVEPWIAGVVGWRDKVLSLIDLRPLLDIKAGDRADRLVVVRTGHGDAAGILAERIGRIARFDPAAYQATPPATAARVSRGIYGDNPATAPAVLDVDLFFEAAWGDRSLSRGAA